MKTTSLALTDSRIRFATVVLPDPVPPEMPIIMLIIKFGFPQRRKGAKKKALSSSGFFFAPLREKLFFLNSTMNATHNSPQQLRKRLSHTIACRDHFLVIDWLVTDTCGHVGDT